MKRNEKISFLRARVSVKRLAVGLLGLFLLVPAGAQAWGRQGHMTVALIAQGLLTPQTQQLVDQLRRAPGWEAYLPGNSHGFNKANRELTEFCRGTNGDLDLVGDWADAWKIHHQATGRFHFLNLPLDSDGGPVAESTACGRGCIVSQLESEVRILADASASANRRLLALLWVVHLVGDIHQPLHCADNDDRGGNAVRVLVGRRQGTLHEAWDTEFFYFEHVRPAELAADILAHEARGVAPGPMDPGSWARESWGVAKSFVYPQERECGGRYGQRQVAEAWPVVRLQLARAGVRLAMVLNRCADGSGR